MDYDLILLTMQGVYGIRNAAGPSPTADRLALVGIASVNGMPVLTTAQGTYGVGDRVATDRQITAIAALSAGAGTVVAFNGASLADLVTNFDDEANTVLVPALTV